MSKQPEQPYNHREHRESLMQVGDGGFWGFGEKFFLRRGFWGA